MRQSGELPTKKNPMKERRGGVGMNGRCQSRLQGDRASSRAGPAGLACRRRVRDSDDRGGEGARVG